MNFIQKYVLLFFSLCFSPISSQNIADSLKSKIEKQLDKENALSNYYSIKNDGVYIYADSLSKIHDANEFYLAFNEINLFKHYSKYLNTKELFETLVINGFNDSLDKLIKKKINKKQSNIRIAIDPGHIAGNMEMAKIENKYIQIKNDSENVNLAEGELTLATAFILKEKLETQGFEVFLTRNKPNETAFGKTYAEWLKKDFRKTIDSLSKSNELTKVERQNLLKLKSSKEIFKQFFREYELKQRANKINSYNPDLTIVIHYNVDEKNTGWKKTSDKNFNMTFIGGSFMKDELEKPEHRIEFLRLLVTDDLKNSELFCKEAISAFSKNLNVPIAKKTDAEYLEKYSMETNSEGVYSRNLTLTRMVHGTVLYGETLYQDNSRETKLLSKKEITIKSLKTSKRVEEVADAYFGAINNYLKNNK